MKTIFSPTIHLLVTLVWLAVAGYMIFLYAPQELTMGEVQRIFYVHVSSAWTALLAYFLIFLGSAAYLWKSQSDRAPLLVRGGLFGALGFLLYELRAYFWKRQGSVDAFAHGAAEVGFVFCTGVLVTGPLWAKPVWGIWWTWDARLTLTFVLWLLFVAYLMLRSYVVNVGRAATLAAVVGIFGFVDVPIDYMAIRWWRTQHPQPVIAGGEGSGLDPRMWITLLVTWGAFLCLFSYLLRLYMRVSKLGREVALARRELISQSGG